MWVTTVRIGGQVYYLPDGTDLPGLKGQFVEAVQAGAAFVEFETEEHGSVSVLMTPHTPVRFERLQRAEAEPFLPDLAPTSFEWDPTAFAD